MTTVAQKTGNSKVSRGFQLPKSISQWIENEQLATGATYSRITTAAICAYMALDQASRTRFMQQAVQKETAKKEH